MDSFCSYLEQSKKHLQKVDLIFRSTPVPISAQEFGLNLYHCLSQVEDAVNELERYTMGYVDNYLHDGKAMITLAKKKRRWLQSNKKEWLIL